MGGKAFVEAMNTTMAYYSNGFGDDMNMSFAHKYPITKTNEPHPNASRLTQPLWMHAFHVISWFALMQQLPRSLTNTGCALVCTY